MNWLGKWAIIPIGIWYVITMSRYGKLIVAMLVGLGLSLILL